MIKYRVLTNVPNNCDKKPCFKIEIDLLLKNNDLKSKEW